MTLAKAASAARRRGAGAVRVTAAELPAYRVYQRANGTATIPLAGQITGAASAIAARVITADTSAEVVPWTTVSSGPGGAGENFTDTTGARPVAWWMFGEVSGNRASGADAGNALSPSTNAPVRGTGPHGQSAADFTKSAAHQFNLAEAAMSATFPGRSTAAQTSVTVGGWFRIDGETGNDGGILGKDTNYQFVIESGVFQFRVFGPNNAATASSLDGANYVQGGWKHYVGRWTVGTGETVLFVNGVKRPAATNNPAITTRNVSSGNFTVGNATFKTNFDGSIAELFVFNSALTDDQVASIYNTGLNGARTTNVIGTASDFSYEFSTEFRVETTPSQAFAAGFSPGFGNSAGFSLTPRGVGELDWTGSMTIPQGGWYKMQYRLATEPAAVFTTNNPFGVGDVWVFAGENQQALMSFSSNAPPAPDPRTVCFNAGATWDLPGVVAGTNGNGVVRFLNTMRATTNVPQACIQVSVAGTSIADWESGDPAYVTATSRIASVGTVAGVLWNQGGSDVGGAVTGANYKTRLTALRNGLGGAGTVQRFGVLPLMPRLAAANTDAAVQEIRRAHYEYIAENPGTVNLGWVPDIPLSDDVNQTAAGSETLAYTYAHAMLHAMGSEQINNLGPSITAASRSGTTVTLTVQHRSGSALRLNVGTAATGFQVFPRGASHVDANALAVSGVTLGTNTVTLTLASNPNSAVDVYYQYGRFDATTPVYDNTSALGRSTGNALQPLMSPVQTAVEAVEEPVSSQGLKFDGTTGLIRYADHPAWDLPDTDWTMGAMLRVDSNAGSFSQYVYSTGGYGAVQAYNFLVYETSWGAAPDRFEFSVRGAGATNIVVQGAAADTALVNNSWRLWIIERVKATETLNLYYLNPNGTRTLYRTVSSTGLGAVIPTVGAAMGTRAPQAAGSERWFNGAVSAFFKIDGLLTATEMQRLAAGDEIISHLARDPAIYVKLNTLTSPLPNLGSGGTTTGGILGGVTLTPGPVFGTRTTAVQFNETNTIYTMADSPSFDMPNGSWTMGFVFAVDNNDGTVSQHIWSTGEYLALQCTNILIYEEGSTRPNMFGIGIRGSGTAIEIVAPSIAATFDGQYRLWTVERDATANTINIYYTPINGTRVLHHTMTPTVTLGAVQPTSPMVTLGCRNANSTPAGRYFGGRIYCAFQMDGAMTQAQTESIARGRDPITDLSLTLRWYHKLTDTNSPRTDLSGNGNTATLSGTATQVAGPTFLPTA